MFNSPRDTQMRFIAYLVVGELVYLSVCIAHVFLCKWWYWFLIVVQFSSIKYMVCMTIYLGFWHYGFWDLEIFQDVDTFGVYGASYTGIYDFKGYSLLSLGLRCHLVCRIFHVFCFNGLVSVSIMGEGTFYEQYDKVGCWD